MNYNINILQLNLQGDIKQLIGYQIGDRKVMQNDRQDKQQYLVSEIIQKGYDAEDFQQYMFQLNGQQIDLSMWSMNDLKNIVQKYQAQKSKQKQIQANQTSPEKNRLQSIQESRELEQDEQYSQIRNKQQTSISTKDLRKMEKMQESGHYLQFNYQTKHQKFSQVLDCIQVPPNQLLNKNCDIKVSRFQKKQGGLFQQSYVSYIVQTPCLGKVVQRRYNDFLWLKTILERLHPGLPIPPIAKKGQYRRYDDKHLNKRRMILEMFLNKLVEIPEVKADQVFENFLKFENRVSFQKFKSEYKSQGSIRLQDVKNTKGKLKMAIDPKINNFLVKSQRHMIETQPMIKKIYKEYKQAATHLQNCANVLKGIAKLTEGMDNIQRLFRKDAELDYCASNTFSILQDSSQKLADILQKQAKSFRSQLYSCIKYESMTMLSNLDAFDKLKSYKANYTEMKNTLFRKKQKLFEQGNKAKWGIVPPPTSKCEKSEIIKKMLPKQTQDLAKVRVKYALRNFQTFQQMNRHYLKNNIFMAKNLLTFTKIQSQLTSQLMMVWVDAQTQVMGMQEGRSIHDAYIG